MKNIRTIVTRSESWDIQIIFSKLLVVIILCALPIFGWCTVRPLIGEITRAIILEINMVEYKSASTNRLKDTLSVSIIETTTGDEYIINTTTGSASIQLSADKHYFIFMSRTGAKTQSVEFQTAGSANSESQNFYIDYDPIENTETEEGIYFNPTSVVKFGNDIRSTIKIEKAGVNIFYD